MLLTSPCIQTSQFHSPVFAYALRGAPAPPYFEYPAGTFFFKLYEQLRLETCRKKQTNKQTNNHRTKCLIRHFPVKCTHPLITCFMDLEANRVLIAQPRNVMLKI